VPTRDRRTIVILAYDRWVNCPNNNSCGSESGQHYKFKEGKANRLLLTFHILD